MVHWHRDNIIRNPRAVHLTQCGQLSHQTTPLQVTPSHLLLHPLIHYHLFTDGLLQSDPCHYNKLLETRLSCKACSGNHWCDSFVRRVTPWDLVSQSDVWAIPDDQDIGDACGGSWHQLGGVLIRHRTKWHAHLLGGDAGSVWAGESQQEVDVYRPNCARYVYSNRLCDALHDIYYFWHPGPDAKIVQSSLSCVLFCRWCSLLDHARIPYHHHTKDFHQWTEPRDEAASHQRGHLRRDFPATRRSYLLRTEGRLDRFLQRLPSWYGSRLQNGHVPSLVSCIQLRAVHHANVYALQKLYSYRYQ